MMRFSAIFLLYLALSLSLSAQSFFASRGLGEEILAFDALTASLGKHFIFSYENPSFPLDLKNTVALGNIYQACLYGKEGRDYRLLYNLKINYAKVLIPFPYETRVGLSLRERFSQDFDVYSVPAGPYYWHVVGKGGINSLSFALGRRFARNLSFGISYDYLFGASEENWSFEAEGRPLVQETVFGRYKGSSIRFAALKDVAKIQFGCGVEIFLPLNYQGYLSVKPELIEEREIRIPPSFHLAASFNLSEYRRVFLGINYKNWREIKIDAAKAGNFTDGLLISVGFSDYLRERYPLRIGYAENFWYLLSRGGKRIGESSLNFGSSVKIPGYGFFDINLEIFHRRGAYLKETGLRLWTSARLEEIWKRRTRRWGY